MYTERTVGRAGGSLPPYAPCVSGQPKRRREKARPLEEPLDEGIFSLKGDRIDCVSLGDGESGEIEVVISGENGERMMLTYSDGVENYDRAG